MRLTLRSVLLSIAAGIFLLTISITPSLSSAQSTDDIIAQLQAQIEQLLAQIAALEAQINQGDGSTIPSPASCLSLSYNLYLGISDAQSNGEVSKLQQFLRGTGDFTYPEITGYFGPSTEIAVQRWQARNNVVASGSPDTTGYGVVGPQTRDALARQCNPVTQPEPTANLSASPSSGPAPLTVYFQGSGSALTQTAGISFGDGTTSSEGGVNVSHTYSNLGTYTATLHKDGAKGEVVATKTITVTSAQSNAPTIHYFTATPSSISSGQAVTLAWSSDAANCHLSWNDGGSSYSEPNIGSATSHVVYPTTTTFYILSCYGHDPGTGKDAPSTQRSVTVTMVQPKQTNPVVINSFSASQASVSSGNPVTFTWNSNLTSNDVSYYGGFCSISAVTSNNQQIKVATGAGASGSINYIPPLTATYTLFCSSGGKDGSPSAQKTSAVTVASTPISLVPTNLSYACNASGTEVTLSWTPVITALSNYYLRVNDIHNESSGCALPTATGSNGYCVSPTDYVNDYAYTPTTITVTPGRTYLWWVHSVKPTTGVDTAVIGTEFTCQAQTALSSQNNLANALTALDSVLQKMLELLSR